jgi:dolichol-phosphate mannosyltransferase
MDASRQRDDGPVLVSLSGLPPQATRLSISLVLPVCNAEKHLARMLRAADEALSTVTSDYEIVVVDGGSTDGTLTVVAAMATLYPALRVLPAATMAGYGTQLRAGIEAAGKEYVALAGLNATLEPQDLARLVLLGPHCGIACGAHIDRQDGWLRRTASRTYSIVTDALLGTNVRDCEGALKLARRETLLALPSTSGSQFIHAELLATARLAGLSVVEVDVAPRKYASVENKISLPSVVASLTETVRFWWTRVMFPGADQVTSPDASASVIRPWHVWLLMAAAALVLFTRLTFPLIEPDEARYALISVGMLDSGELLVPRREGSFYLDKPPLLYWLTVASFWALGVHDYAARTVTALAGVGTLVSTYCIGRHLVGRRGALLGSLMLVLSLGFLLASRFLIMDGLLTLFTTISLLSMYTATQGPRLRRGWWLLAAVSCGFGVMTKGPVALVLTLPPWIVSRWLVRKGIAGLSASTSAEASNAGAAVRLRDWLWYGAGVVAVALPWFIAVTIREPGFLKYFFWEHHVMRFTTNMIHVEPWWFYIPALAIGMFPSSILLPVLAVYLFRRSTTLAVCRTPAQGFLLLSAAWTVGFFSLATGKLAPYILPAIPMISLLIGAMLDRAVLGDINDKFMARMKRWIPFHGTRTALLAGMVLGVVDFVLDRGESDQWAESSILVFGSAVLYWYVSRRSFAERPARWMFAAGVPLAVLAIGIADIYPTIATKRSLAAQVEAVRRELGDADTPIICFGRYEDSLIFYNRERGVRQFNIDQTDEVGEICEAHPRVLVLSQDIYIPQLREKLPDVVIEEQADSRGKLYIASTSNVARKVTSGPPGESRR